MAKKTKTVDLDERSGALETSEQKRQNYLEAVESIDLDKVNMDRVEKSRARLSEAIAEVDSTALARIPYYSSNFNVDWLRAQKKLAKATNLVSASREEMEFACHHFRWNDEIVSDLEAVLERLGVALAAASLERTDDASSAAFEALVKIAPALAVLTVWNDDEDGEE